MGILGALGGGAAVASIIIGDPQPTDSGADYTAAYDDPESVWTDYYIINRYEKDRHVAMMPIAAPGGFAGKKVAFCQLAEPTLIWICDWTACRFNESPKIPEPDLIDKNWVLMDEHYAPAMLKFSPDGETPLYRISGTYVYGHKSPDQRTIHDINYGLPAWIEHVFDRAVHDDDMEPDLIDIEGGGASSEASASVGTAAFRGPSPGDPGALG